MRFEWLYSGDRFREAEKLEPFNCGMSDCELCYGVTAAAVAQEVNEARMSSVEVREAQPTTKPTNPKDALGIKKMPLNLLPPQVLGEMSVAMLEGALKYGPFNWRESGANSTVYLAAARRHLSQFEEGEDIDEESGLSHITKAISSLLVLRDAMMMGNWNDDRPAPADNPRWAKDLNNKVADLLRKYER